MNNLENLGTEFHNRLAQLQYLFHHQVLQEIYAILDNIIEESFRQKRYMGKPASPAWPARKKNKDPDRALLILSGDMRRSLRVSIQGDRLIISSNSPYAQAHNEGGNITLPARSEVFLRARSVRGKKKGTFSKEKTPFAAGQGFTVAERTISMSKRQFMPIPGQAIPALEQELSAYLNAKLEAIFSPSK